jgi:transcriptional repressor NrdR
VEDSLRCNGWAEVPAHEVGLAILGPLRELDEVAYLRFASVYRAFESADDFETEIAMLRAERPAGAPDETEPLPGQRPARAGPAGARAYQKT